VDYPGEGGSAGGKARGTSNRRGVHDQTVNMINGRQGGENARVRLSKEKKIGDPVATEEQPHKVRRKIVGAMGAKGKGHSSGRKKKWNNRKKARSFLSRGV